MIRILTFPALLLLFGMAAAQNLPAPSQAPAAATAGHDSHPPATPATAPAPALPAVNANPQSQLMLANADKLVELAQQLKTEVDKSNQFTLSLNALRRAQDVEKLAKDLQKQLQHSKK
jgi:hypothetical protein